MSNKKEDYKYDSGFGVGGPPDIDISKLVD